MNSFFQHLTVCAAVGSVCSGILLLLRHTTRRVLGANKQYYLWILLLLLWVLPLRFSLPISYEESGGNTVLPSIAHLSGITETYHVSHSPEDDIPFSIHDTITPQEQNTVSILPILWSVWGIGIPIVLGFQYIPYIRFRKLLKSTALPFHNSLTHTFGIPVYNSSAVHSPIVVGLLRPVLYLPEYTYSERELFCILRHELTHIKRWDIPLKWFAASIRCLHWWNPLVHLAVQQFCEECEISCDFRVAAPMNTEDRKVYMKLLLDLADAKCRKQGFLTTGFTDSKQFLKRRLLMIQNGKKQKIIVTLLSFLLLTGLSAGLIYGSGVFRNTLLPDETDWQKELPVLETLIDEETLSVIEQIPKETLANVYLPGPETEASSYEELEETYTDIYVDTPIYMDDEICLSKLPIIYKPDREITSGYGFHRLSWQKEEIFHRGIDFRGATGEAVTSLSAGEIVYMGYDYSYGNMIIIRSGAYEIYYAHLSEFSEDFSEGDSVDIGTVIGKIGQTGAVTGPHLHLEIILDGQPIDPASVWVE